MNNVSKNDVTGDSIQTKNTSKLYLNNYDIIFRKSSLVDVESENTKTKDENEIQKNSD